MDLGAVGIATFAAGVFVFVLATYGALGEASLYGAAAALAVILAGLSLLAYAARAVPRSLPRLLVTGLAAVGIGLYIKFGLFDSDNFRPGWMLWAATPYIVCIALSCFAPIRTPATVGVIAALLFDCYVHYGVYHSHSSTAAIAYVWSPLWNTLIVVPVATFISWAVVRKRRLQSAP